MENKKSKKADLGRKIGQHFLMGLTISLSLTLVAFEWRTPKEFASTPVFEEDVQYEQEEAMEVTYRKVKKLSIPKPPVPPKDVPIDQPLDIVDNKTVVEQLVKVASSEPTTDIDISTLFSEDTLVIEDFPREFAEIMPEYYGGTKELFKYLGQELKYPRRAIDAGIEGTVYVEFIVNKDGSIAKPKVMRGIGGGCDEEAIRVVKNMKNWKPGVQGGRNVRVLFRLPIKFTLKN